MPPETAATIGKRKRSEDGIEIEPIISQISPITYTHPITSYPDTQIASRLLCIPVSFIMRRSIITSTESPKSLSPLLLSKGEAALFLRVHLLARQLDHLLQLSYEALYRMSVCRYVSSNILSPSNHPSHRALLPMLYMHGWTLPERILHNYVPMEVRRILQVELHPLIRSLRDLADQNWNYVQLLEQPHQNLLPFGSSTSSFVSPSINVLPTLAWEKSIVAQTQEILSSRIEHLIEKGLFIDDMMDESMEDMCIRLTTQQSSDETLYSEESSTIKTINDINIVIQDEDIDLKSGHTITNQVIDHNKRKVLGKEGEMKVEISTNHSINLKTLDDNSRELEAIKQGNSSFIDGIKLSCSQIPKGEECWAQLYG